MQYLKNFLSSSQRQSWDDSVPGIINALQTVAAGLVSASLAEKRKYISTTNFSHSWTHYRKLRLASDHIEQRKRAGRTPEEAVNLTSIELARTADAHCRAFLVQSGYEMIEKSCATVSPELARALRDIYELYAYDEAMKMVGDLLRVSRERFRLTATD